MSLVREPGPPPVRRRGARARRGRPPARNEILRDGRLGGIDPAELAERFGTPFYAYDLDVVTRQVEALRGALPDAFDLAYAVKANPNLAVLRHLAGLGLGRGRRVRRGAAARPARRASRRRRSCSPAPASATRSCGRRSRPASASSPSSRRASCGASRRIAESLGRRQPVLLRAAVSEAARLERVRLVGDDGAGKFGMDGADLRAAAAEAACLALARAARASTRSARPT